MIKMMLLLLTFALFTGCSSKEQESLMQSYNKDKNYHMKLQKTEKTQLYDAQLTKAMLTATYLFEQSADTNDTRDEVFIVGIYAEENENDSFNVNSFDEDEYTLVLNGKSPKNVKQLNASDPMLKDISFVSDWSQFYLVTFPHTSSKSFKLVFESYFYGKGELHFAKVAKFVLTKQAF